jgi:hypothetical protein
MVPVQQLLSLEAPDFPLSSRPERSWASGPPQGDEKRLLFSNYCPSKHRTSLCHLDRSAAKWRDLRFNGPFLEMFFDSVISTGVSMGLRPTEEDENGAGEY